MLWIINSLIYGFFTSIYTLFNQHYKINGYILGIWRGFGISIIFIPLLFFVEIPTSAYYWGLLFLQGYMIAVYDSHLFFASAKYGAGPTSRFMAITVLMTTFVWWLLTPQQFFLLINNGSVFITLILILFGFTFCYWQMIQTEVSRKVAKYVLPGSIALSGMSIITKYIATEGHSIWQGIIYYLVVATFVSGCFNLKWYILSEKNKNIKEKVETIFSKKMFKVGTYLISFSTVLITAKTMALRIAPNPGYVIALLLIAPIFVFLLNKYYKIPDTIAVKTGFSMIFFLILLVLLVNGNYGIVD